jgi:hypothetical protein
VDAILDEWGEEDKKNGFSSEVCRAIYWQYRRDQQEQEFKRSYPEEFISDSELEFRISQLPPSWRIAPNYGRLIEEGCRYAVSEIQIEQDMADPVKTAQFRAGRRMFELEEELEALEKKQKKHKDDPESIQAPIIDRIASARKELEDVKKQLPKEREIPSL